MAKDDASDEDLLPALRLHHLHLAPGPSDGAFAAPRPEPIPEAVAAAALLEWPGPTRPVGGPCGASTERPDLADVVGCLPVRLDARGRQLVVLNEDCTAELLSIRACLVEIRGGWDRDTGCPIIAVQAPRQFGVGAGKAPGIWLIAVADVMVGANRVLAALSAVGGIRSDFGAAYHLDPNVSGAGATSEIYKAFERPKQEDGLRALLGQSSPVAWWGSCWAAEEPPTELETPEPARPARGGAAPPAPPPEPPAAPAPPPPKLVGARLVREGGRSASGAASNAYASCSLCPSSSSGFCEGFHCAPFAARDALPLGLEEELFILSAVQGHPNVARLHGLFFLAGEEARRRARRNGLLEGDDEEGELPIVSSCFNGGGNGAAADGTADSVTREREDAPVWALVTDYYFRGNLYRSLGRVPSEARAQEVMRGLLSGLHHIHDRGVIHRDVKIEHIFVSDNGQPVLADFESACWADDRREICRRVGTPGYMAPEMFMERVYNEKVDVFAAGVVMFFALSRVQPFLGGNSASTQRRTCHLEVEFPRYSAFDLIGRPCKDLLHWMLVKNPGRRPHADEALDHAWFAEEGTVPSAPPLPLAGRFCRRPPGAASPQSATAEAESPPPAGPPAGGGSREVSASPPLPPAQSSRPMSGAAGREDAEGAGRMTWEATRWAGSGSWAGGEDGSEHLDETRGTSPGGTPVVAAVSEPRTAAAPRTAGATAAGGGAAAAAALGAALGAAFGDASNHASSTAARARSHSEPPLGGTEEERPPRAPASPTLAGAERDDRGELVPTPPMPQADGVAPRRAGLFTRARRLVMSQSQPPEMGQDPEPPPGDPPGQP